MTPVNGPCRHLGLEQRHGVVVGVAGVDDQRQAGGARGRDVGAEAGRLPVARAEIVEIVEAALADRDHPRMRGELDQRCGIVEALPAGLVGMDADRAEHLGPTLGQRDADRPAGRVWPRCAPWWRRPRLCARSITPASSSARPG